MNYRECMLTMGLGVGLVLLGATQGRGESREQSNCADHGEIVSQLAEKYGETRQFMALTFARQVVELFASPDTGTWTLTITFPSGETCLIGAGDMIDLAPDVAPAGDPA